MGLIEYIETQLQCHNYENAAFYAEVLLAHHPNSQHKHLLAECHARQQNWGNVISILEGDANTQSRKLYSEACLNLGLFREGIQSLIGSFGSGCIPSDLGRVTQRGEAINCFRECLSLDPMNFSAFEELCNLGINDVNPLTSLKSEELFMDNEDNNELKVYVEPLLHRLGNAKYRCEEAIIELNKLLTDQIPDNLDSETQQQQQQQYNQSFNTQSLITSSNNEQQKEQYHQHIQQQQYQSIPFTSTISSSLSFSIIPTQFNNSQSTIQQKLCPYSCHLQQGWVLEHLGRAYSEAMENNKACESFAMMLRKAPYHLEGTDIYSSCLHTLGRIGELSSLATNLSQLDSHSLYSLISCGNLYSLLNQRQKALLCFQRACQLYPFNKYPFTLAGHECCEQGNYPLALSLYRQSLLISPLNVGSWYGLGVAYHHLQRYGLAEAHFARAAMIHPRSLPVLYRLGVTITETKNANQRVEEAMSIFERALKLSPDNVLIRTRRAVLLFSPAIQRGQEALQELHSLVQRQPQEPLLHYLLGSCLIANQKPLEAFVSFGRAFDLCPSDDLYRTSFEKLSHTLRQRQEQKKNEKKRK